MELFPPADEHGLSVQLPTPAAALPMAWQREPHTRDAEFEVRWESIPVGDPVDWQREPHSRDAEFGVPIQLLCQQQPCCDVRNSSPVWQALGVDEVQLSDVADAARNWGLVAQQPQQLPQWQSLEPVYVINTDKASLWTSTQ